jgi:O-antigen/teichoic acid export membrane protein
VKAVSEHTLQEAVSLDQTRPAPVEVEATGDSDWKRHAISSFGFNAVALVANLLTGILIARMLGTSGRGEVTAILTAPALLGWAFTLGCSQAAAYHQARSPRDAGRLIATWLVFLLPLGAACVLVGQAVLPWLLAAQSDATYDLARVIMLTAALTLFSELFFGILLGDQDFLFYNAMRLAQPGALAVAYVVLAGLDRLSVTSAVIATVAVSTVALVVVTVRALRRHGFGRPSITLGRSTAWYGLRAHAVTIGSMANARLDLLILPAFLGASSVGLYAVATSASWIVVTIAGALYPIVLPAAARGTAAGTRFAVRSLQATLAIGAVAALGLGLLADVAVRLVYGSAFEGSVLPLRLLLAGSVLFAGAQILGSALSALNRPLTAAATQLIGAVATVAGLLVFLRDGGITAAAIVSAVSYALVFVSALVLYRRASGLEWVALLPSKAEVRQIARAGRRTRQAKAAQVQPALAGEAAGFEQASPRVPEDER